MCRPQEPGRTRRRHSKFWIGLYRENWLIAHDCCWELVESMIGLVRNKQPFYNRGLKAIKHIGSGGDNRPRTVTGKAFRAFDPRQKILLTDKIIT